jgi:hypothetical protein
VTSAPAAAPAERAGRNDPCPCGSGCEFKQCCGKAHPAAVAASLLAMPGPIGSISVPLSEAGRLREAAEEFRHSQQVDQAQPDVVERRLVGDTGCLRSDPAQ